MKKYFFFLVLLISVFNIASSFFSEVEPEFLSMEINNWIYRGIWFIGLIVGVFGILESQKKTNKK